MVAKSGMVHSIGLLKCVLSKCERIGLLAEDLKAERPSEKSAKFMEFTLNVEFDRVFLLSVGINYITRLDRSSH